MQKKEREIMRAQWDERNIVHALTNIFYRVYFLANLVVIWLVKKKGRMIGVGKKPRREASMKPKK